MHSKGDNIEIMINDKKDEVTEELFQSHISRCQIVLETWRKGSLYLIVFIYCIVNVLKWIQIKVDHI